MLRPLIVIRRTPKIDFMKWHKLGFAFSALLTLSSIVLFLTVGLNYGIDFVGGTQIEVRVTSGPANLGEMRQKLDALKIGDVSLQGFGPSTDVLIRLSRQPGGDAAQEQAVELARKALGPGIDYRRIEVVGPTVGGELIRAGVIATILALVAIACYIAFRFEWQFGVGGMVSTLHDQAGAGAALSAALKSQTAPPSWPRASTAPAMSPSSTRCGNSDRKPCHVLQHR